MSAPLEDITVVTIENFVATPSCSALLADLGANVIKIEPHGGDPVRTLSNTPKVDGPLGKHKGWFDVDNRGKRSICVAINTEAGQKIIHQLISKAQIFICNLLPHRQQRFSFDPDTLLAINPSLVHATFSGYGTAGPDASRPGFDVTAYWGRSGLSEISRADEDDTIQIARPGVGDHISGITLLSTVLAGLRQAERTGKGQVVETSLYETAIWAQATDFSVTVNDHAPVSYRNRYNTLTPMMNSYPCGDGKWVVLHMMDKDAWPRLCKAIGREEWLEDERFQNGKERYKRMRELVGMIEEALAVRNRDEWGRIFDELGVIWGPIMSLDEAAQDPQAHALDMFPELHHPEIGSYRTVSAPMRFHNADVRPRGPAPAFAADTREVLGKAGFSESEIDDLLEAGVIAIN